MTATMDKNGNLVLGSSRQFCGFGNEVEEPIVQCILEHAAQFIPDLNDLRLKLNDNREIRVGLRPYVHDGKPMIGPIANLPKVFLATGHEGSGLSLALGTAEMVSDMILETPSKLDCTLLSRRQLVHSNIRVLTSQNHMFCTMVLVPRAVRALNNGFSTTVVDDL
ncbi:hypothetical protein HPP92_002747 [Vanilla planifolia]|uniref:FAD-dependent oxidoreductase domain-containing protein 1 n=1 Tax=Vanilla planifolia TaxID=51239 RepID=A0A835VIS3_VANPL|nr:hypothetical protein HPP92_002747 [Vanilla planifolia]